MTTDNYLWNIKIDVSAYTGEDNHFIKLREPTNGEYKTLAKCQSLMGKATEDIDCLFESLEQFCGMLNTLIIDHDFYDGEKKMPAKDVAAFVNAKTELSQYIMTEYVTALPLYQKNRQQ